MRPTRSALEALVARIGAVPANNRKGPTGFVDLYFRPRILRFEGMLDPE